MPDNALLVTQLDELQADLVTALAPFGGATPGRSFAGEPDQALTYGLYLLEWLACEDGSPGGARATFQVDCYQKTYDSAWPLLVAATLMAAGYGTRIRTERYDREIGYHITPVDAAICRRIKKEEDNL